MRPKIMGAFAKAVIGCYTPTARARARQAARAGPGGASAHWSARPRPPRAARARKFLCSSRYEPGGVRNGMHSRAALGSTCEVQQKRAPAPPGRAGRGRGRGRSRERPAGAAAPAPHPRRRASGGGIRDLWRAHTCSSQGRSPVSVTGDGTAGRPLERPAAAAAAPSKRAHASFEGVSARAGWGNETACTHVQLSGGLCRWPRARPRRAAGGGGRSRDRAPSRGRGRAGASARVHVLRVAVCLGVTGWGRKQGAYTRVQLSGALCLDGRASPTGARPPGARRLGSLRLCARASGGHARTPLLPAWERRSRRHEELVAPTSVLAAVASRGRAQDRAGIALKGGRQCRGVRLWPCFASQAVPRFVWRPHPLVPAVLGCVWRGGGPGQNLRRAAAAATAGAEPTRARGGAAVHVRKVVYCPNGRGAAPSRPRQDGERGRQARAPAALTRRAGRGGAEQGLGKKLSARALAGGCCRVSPGRLSKRGAAGRPRARPRNAERTRAPRAGGAGVQQGDQGRRVAPQPCAGDALAGAACRRGRRHARRVRRRAAQIRTFARAQI